MGDFHISSQHILTADTRYVISRQAWDWPTTLAKACFPADPSKFTSDKVWIEDFAHLMRRQPGYTGTGGTASRVNYQMSGTKQWDIPVLKWEIVNAIEEDSNADPAIQPRVRRQRNALIKAKMEREIQCARILQDPAIMTQNKTLGVGTRFDDILSPNSDPIAEIRNAARLIRQTTGLKVDNIIIPWAGYLKMCQHQKIQQEAVSKLDITKDRLLINNHLIERLLDDSLIEPGAVKTYEAWFNDTADGPAATDQEAPVYPMGNIVVMTASAKPGGSGGNDFGFGLLKWWDLLRDALPDAKDLEIAVGNEGFAVTSFPLMEGLGGDRQFLVSAAAPFVQNARAAFVFYNAFNAADTASYGTLFQSY